MSKKSLILTIIALALLAGIAVGAVILSERGKGDALPEESETATEAETATETEAPTEAGAESASDTTSTPQTQESGEVNITESTSHEDPVPTQEPQTQPTLPPALTFEEYDSMDGQAQREYMFSFPNLDDFFNWYNAAKEAYESTRDTIEFDGSGDLVIG